MQVVAQGYRRVAVALSPAVALGLTACLPEFERIEGEHLLYEYSDELHPCAGNAEYLDRAIPLLEEQLGVQASPRLRYSWLSKADLERIPDGFHVEAPYTFTVADHAMGSNPASLHEIVHLVMDAPTAPFFREGVAVAFASIYPEGDGPRYPHGAFPDPRDTMEAGRSSQVSYSAAGQFVTFLLTRHGATKFRQFYESLRWPHTMPRIRAVFREVYGIELDAEIDVFMAGVPECAEDHFDLQFGDCSAPLVPWPGPVWFIIEPLECDAPGVVGGSKSAYIFKPMTLEVPEAGRYELRNGTDPDIWIRFGPCFGCPWDFKDVNLEDNESVQLDLEAGKYYLRTITTSGESRTAGVSLHRLDR